MKPTLAFVLTTLLALQARANFCVDPANYNAEKEATLQCENLDMASCMAGNEDQSACVFQWEDDKNKCEVHGTRGGATDTSLEDCCEAAGGSADDLTTCGQQWAHLGFSEGDTCSSVSAAAGGAPFSQLLPYLGTLGCCGDGPTACASNPPNICTDKDAFNTDNVVAVACSIAAANCSDSMNSGTCQYSVEDDGCTIRGSAASQCCEDAGGSSVAKSCYDFLTLDLVWFAASQELVVNSSACPTDISDGQGYTFAAFLEGQGALCCEDQQVDCSGMEVFEPNGPPSPPPPPSSMCNRADRFRANFTAESRCVSITEEACLAAAATSSCTVEYDSEKGCEFSASVLTTPTGAAGCCTDAGGEVEESTSCELLQNYINGAGYDTDDAEVCDSMIFEGLTKAMLQSRRVCCTDATTHCDADPIVFTYEQSNSCLNPTSKSVFTFGDECNKWQGEDGPVYIKTTAAGGNCSVEFYSDAACSATTTNPLEEEIGTTTVVNGDCYTSTSEDEVSYIRISCGDNVPDLPTIPGVVIDEDSDSDSDAGTSDAGVLVVGAALSALYLL